MLDEQNRALFFDATKGSADVVTKHGSRDIGILYFETSIKAVCVLVDILLLQRSLICISERLLSIHTFSCMWILFASYFLFGAMYLCVDARLEWSMTLFTRSMSFVLS